MVKEKDKKDKVIHIYDFLIRCKINRNQHNIFMTKFESQGLKTIEEWQKLTNCILNQ